MAEEAAPVARPRIFYGWKVAAAGFISMFVLRGMDSFGFSVFVKPMTEDLGWTRAMFAGVQSFSTLANGIISFAVGPLIDKRGARGLMIFGAILAGLGFIGLSQIRGIWDFYLTRALLVAIGITCAGSLPVNVALANWFVRKRGKATAMGFMGASLGGVVMVPFAAYLITAYGWRTAWIVIALVVWVVVIPPVAIYMKRRPEDVGLLPDGERPAGGEGSEFGDRETKGQRLSPVPRPLSPEVTWTRAEAVRTPALWLTMLAFGFGGMGVAAMSIHFFSLLTDIGLTEAGAAAAISVQAIFSSLAKVVMGFIIDKYQVRYCGIVAFAVCALAFAVFAILTPQSPIWLAYFAACFAGATTGGTTTIQEVLWANYFGRLSLGAIRTIAMPFSIIFSAGGPFFAGWAYDRFGNYQLAFGAFSACLIVGLALLYVARAPKKKALNPQSG